MSKNVLIMHFGSTLRVYSLMRHARSTRLLYAAPASFSHRASHTSSTSSHQTPQQLYPGHILTSPFQKALLTGISAFAAIRDPARDDMICAMGEASGSCALASIKKRMLANPDGQRILQERPIISKETVDLQYLSQLEEHTLGKAYFNFLNLNGFDPDSRRPVQFVDDPELAYIMLRYRQMHDITHTILDMKPNMLGEVAVKWYEAIQTGLPMCIAAAIGGPFRLGPKHRRIWSTQLFPWSIKNGFNSNFMLNLYVENHWETPIEELRARLGITTAPCNNVNSLNTKL
ncbi:COQ4 [Bugula neritina]|uniref:Ubiquinone biosynthesis protein COQ4 homolog, mitochondrial n=1 Tax=Bugula neritina TaxID=10212 RepID=A0A7J7IWS9_BUGNE|nr:COQ4 [Bugula neritina]